MLRSAWMNAIPPYPPTVWALVERAAEQWAEHVLLADDHGRSLTGRALRDVAEGVAADLAARGVTAGTVVSWQLPTTLETMVVMGALARLGAIQNPLIPILREREVGFITNQVGTQVFLTTERWRGFEHGDLARTLAREQGFDSSSPTSTPTPRPLATRSGSRRAIDRPSRLRRRTGRSCGGSTRRREPPRTRRECATPTGR